MSQPDYLPAPLPRERVNGITLGSLAHRILLALRAGQMLPEQLWERFPTGGVSHALGLLRRAGLVNEAANGVPDQPVYLTEHGRRMASQDGPLARRKTLINYCHME